MTGDGRHCPVEISRYCELMNGLFHNKKIVIFSDDVNFINSLEYFNGCYTVSSGNHFVEMCLMSMFKNIIISNSTFSWWGAYLSISPDNVFIPLRWFGPKLSHLDVRGLYVNSWKTF